jgi:hypothetical protein
MWGIYSLRKRMSSYSGSGIRVRRSSDNAEFDIGFASDGTLDIASLSSYVGSGDGYVTKWYDQSGFTNNFAQTISSLQPSVMTSGVYSGKIIFDGVSQRLDSSNSSGTPTDVSIYAFANIRNLTGQEQILLSLAPNFNITASLALIIPPTGNFQVAIHAPTGGSIASLIYGFQPSGNVVGQITFRNGSTPTDKIKTYLDGVLKAFTTNASSADISLVSGPYVANPWYLGSNFSGAGPAALDVTDLVIYETGHSATSVQAITTIITP